MRTCWSLGDCEAFEGARAIFRSLSFVHVSPRFTTRSLLSKVCTDTSRTASFVYSSTARLGTADPRALSLPSAPSPTSVQTPLKSLREHGNQHQVRLTALHAVSTSKLTCSLPQLRLAGHAFASSPTAAPTQDPRRRSSSRSRDGTRISWWITLR